MSRSTINNDSIIESINNESINVDSELVQKYQQLVQTNQQLTLEHYSPDDIEIKFGKEGIIMNNAGCRLLDQLEDIIFKYGLECVTAHFVDGKDREETRNLPEQVIERIKEEFGDYPAKFAVLYLTWRGTDYFVDGVTREIHSFLQS